METDERLRFRKAMAQFATGVTVITTGTEEEPSGMTASAVCSLSMEPRLLLVCISNHLPTHAAVENHGRFAVNVLGEGDEATARTFATPGVDKFAGLDLGHDAGAPVLRSAIAHFVCSTHERIDGGDHSIFIGAVQSFEYLEDRPPLLFFGSAFRSVHQPSVLDGYPDLGLGGM